MDRKSRLAAERVSAAVDRQCHVGPAVGPAKLSQKSPEIVPHEKGDTLRSNSSRGSYESGVPVVREKNLGCSAGVAQNPVPELTMAASCEG